MSKELITNEMIDSSKDENAKSNKKQMVLIILCWISYIFAYLGRYGFSANINLIISDYGVTKSQVGLVTSLFFFAYGVGQIVNGILSKRYNKRVIIPIALILSAIFNICIFAGIPFEYIKYLWLLNGFSQSILWPTLIEILSKNTNQKKLKTAIIFMSTTTPLGTFFVYGMSAVLVSFNVYKYIFLIATISMISMGILWFFSYNKYKSETEMAKESTDVSQETQPVQKNKITSMLMIFITTMCIFAIFDNLIKDGLTTWVPTILKDLYNLPDNLSILLTILLPVLGTFGALLAIAINKTIKNYSLLTVLFYAISLILLSSSFLVINSKFSWIALIILFGLTVLNMHAINNVVTSMVPLFMREKINSGLLAGILNGFCYVGSTISSYGLAKIVETSNSWNTMFYSLIGGAILCIIVGMIEYFISAKANKNKQ